MTPLRRQRRLRRRGVTLIELVIAITLVSLLATGLLFAMRVGLNAMDSSNRRILASRRTIGAHRILEQQVGGLIPALVSCGPPGAPKGPPTPYFQGAPQVMRFVSTYSLQESARGRPQIATLFVIPGENGQGVRLVVNETLYTGPVSAGFSCLPPQPGQGSMVPRFPEPIPGGNSFVLADRLAVCRFLFLEVPPPVPNALPQERWVPIWTRNEWPRAIRIEMAPLEPDPSRVQALPFTTPIHVTRQPWDDTRFY